MALAAEPSGLRCADTMVFAARDATMAGSMTLQMRCAMFSFCVGLLSVHAEARSASVGVSVRFDVAPADLIWTRNVAPSALRSCTSLKERVALIWAAETRKPTLDCRTNQAMPLIVTEQNEGFLVVRP